MPLYRHYNKKDHLFPDDAKFSILELTRKQDLLVRESHWMDTLNSRLPHGPRPNPSQALALAILGLKFHRATEGMNNPSP